MVTNRRSRVTPETVERRRRVVQMREARMSFVDIGARLGVSPQRAHQVYRAALAAHPAQAIDEHRHEALALIDRAVRGLLLIAVDPAITPTARVAAWLGIARWAERHAKLLGLDAPVKARIEVLTGDVIDAALHDLIAETGIDPATVPGLDTDDLITEEADR